MLSPDLGEGKQSHMDPPLARAPPLRSVHFFRKKSFMHALIAARWAYMPAYRAPADALSPWGDALSQFSKDGLSQFSTALHIRAAARWQS